MLRGSQSSLQHIQALQSGRPLDAPWKDAPVGVAAIGLAQPPLAELFAGCDAADPKKLQEVMQTAQFWIALLEGERSDLAEEVAKYKQRHQLALRQSETQAKAFREVEIEKKHLASQLKQVQQARDDAICERHLLREDKKKSQETQPSKKEPENEPTLLAGRVQELEGELAKDREETAFLESQLVQHKVRYAEALQRADSLEVLIHFYEDRLGTLDPNFEPADLSTIGQWMPCSLPKESDSEMDAASNASEPVAEEQEDSHSKKKGLGLKRGLTKVGRFFSKGMQKTSKEDLEAEAPAAATPRGTVLSEGAASDADASPPTEVASPAEPIPRWKLRASSSD